ncbi:hypothetical protein WMY93_028226 [Mugilogobius chulae]|uniref:Ribosomal RNA-processing protein 8 n=1 Tax=Mugilogobius chulae TaxID=88201 RepID=A0AAW0MMQ0_9GOBI
MFLEDEDWNDDRSSVPSPAVAKANEPSSPSKKTKVVGKKSLLRTLQTLGSVPEWKSEETHRDSDSDGETAHTEHTKKKRKKKRRKRKHGDAEEERVEGEAEVSEESPVKKKSEPQREKSEIYNFKKPKDQETPKPADNSDSKLSRKQWRNRIKNKKKSKNKFKPNVATEKTEKTDVNGNINTSKDNQEIKKKSKKRKRKISVEPADSEIEENDKKQATDTDNEIPKQANFELNKKTQMKKKKLRRLLQETKAETEVGEEPEVEVGPTAAEAPEPQDPSASLRSRMEQRLDSARFRYINEVLYSSTSREARRMFSQDQEAFWVYHRGYSAQVQRWPHNPVDDIIQFIKQKPASLVVVDFGCGDCKIAKSVKNKVHSYDLVATCELATACDMANVPLKDSSVDIAIFCLSLMGTNLADFLKEANRVLKKGGFLKIAEVSSRFESVRSFVTALANLGFKLQSKDTENTHFYSFDFVKTGPAPENVKKFGLQLKPCVYKKR